jgi:hypothetical protein
MVTASRFARPLRRGNARFRPLSRVSALCPFQELPGCDAALPFEAEAVGFGNDPKKAQRGPGVGGRNQVALLQDTAGQAGAGWFPPRDHLRQRLLVLGDFHLFATRHPPQQPGKPGFSFTQQSSFSSAFNGPTSCRPSTANSNSGACSCGSSNLHVPPSSLNYSLTALTR